MAVLQLLVIDLADDGQVETAGWRVNVHYEVGAPTRPFEPAPASHEVEETLINSRDWIQDSVNLNLKPFQILSLLISE
jgi:hypothetical protein